MIAARVITVCDPAEPGVVHSKFSVRRRYVEGKLIPSLQASGLDASVFQAITPKRSVIKDGRIHAGGLSVALNNHGCPNNFLSNMLLWRECVTTGGTLLICEDDALLPDGAVGVVTAALDDFDRDEDRGDILFLLAQNPSVRDLIRCHPEDAITPAAGSLVRLGYANDLSCTAAYALRPVAAAALLERSEEKGHDATDCFVHTAFREGRIGVVVPKDYQNTFMLHEVWEPYCHTEV